MAYCPTAYESVCADRKRENEDEGRITHSQREAHTIKAIRRWVEAMRGSLSSPAFTAHLILMKEGKRMGETQEEGEKNKIKAALGKKARAEKD